MKFNPNSKRTLFLHIPKTAGTSLRAFLEGLYPEPYCHKGWFTDSLLMLPPWELAEKYFIAGHYPASILGWLPHNRYRIITFAREPIARSLSHFNHLKTASDAFMHYAARDSDLGSFLSRDDGLYELANIQTRFLGALDLDSDYYPNLSNISKADADAVISGPHIEKLFQRAIDFLEKCDVVGIVEQMQDSMLSLASSLGLSSQASLGHSNRGILNKPAISDDSLKILREINSFDLKLYDEAKRILAKRISTLTAEQVDVSYRKRFTSLHPIRNWRYTPEDAAFAYGWHSREQIEDGWARWTAVENAYIDIPRLMASEEYTVSFRAGFYSRQQYEEFRFTVNGVSLPLESVCCNENIEFQRIYRCHIPESLIKDCKDFIRLGWEVDSLFNPAKTLGKIDNRDLGVYLWWFGIDNGNQLF